MAADGQENKVQWPEPHPLAHVPALRLAPPRSPSPTPDIVEVLSTSSLQDELNEPLLPASSGAVLQVQTQGSSYWDCVGNLCKCVFGAGMMALPRACALLGAWLGLGLLGVVGMLTCYSISHGLVHPSSSPTYFAQGPQAMSYSTLVRTYLGNAPVQLLNAFLLANAIGYSVMYIDVMADLLVGSDDSPGLLVDVLPVWLLARPLFLALLVAVVITPISLQRNIASLKGLNAIGLAALAALGLSVAWLAISAVAQGKGFPIPMWPDCAALQRLGGSPWMAALSPLPVILAADGCHMNVLPMASSMKQFSRRNLDSVVAMSMTVCTIFYALFAAASITAFGPHIHEDMLQNLVPTALAPLLGLRQAHVVAYVVRISYTLSLLGSFGLNLFPLRDALFDVLLGSGEGKALAQQRYFTAVTLTVLLLIYGLAVSIPSIWVVIGLVGSIASTGVCYLFPAAMMFAHRRAAHDFLLAHQADALLVFVIGLFIMVNGLVNPL